MINFFRRIRKKLADDNQLLKYSRYAIGEIVLVVIGILIALQINNWNEERKLKTQELATLIELRQALESNKNTLVEKQKLFQKVALESKLLLTHIKEKKAYNDSLRNYFKLPETNFSVGLSYATFENLKSQGFGIISNRNLRLEIIKLYDEDFGLIKDQEMKVSNLLTNSISPSQFKFFEYSLQGLTPNDYSQLLQSNEFSNIVSFTEFIGATFYYLCDKAELKAQKLIEDISIEIENKRRK